MHAPVSRPEAITGRPNELRNQEESAQQLVSRNGGLEPPRNGLLVCPPRACSSEAGGGRRVEPWHPAGLRSRLVNRVTGIHDMMNRAMEDRNASGALVTRTGNPSAISWAWSRFPMSAKWHWKSAGLSRPPRQHPTSSHRRSLVLHRRRAAADRRPPKLRWASHRRRPQLRAGLLQLLCLDSLILLLPALAASPSNPNWSTRQPATPAGGRARRTRPVPWRWCHRLPARFRRSLGIHSWGCTPSATSAVPRP